MILLFFRIPKKRFVFQITIRFFWNARYNIKNQVAYGGARVAYTVQPVQKTFRFADNYSFFWNACYNAISSIVTRYGLAVVRRTSFGVSEKSPGSNPGGAILSLKVLVFKNEHFQIQNGTAGV